MAIDFKALAAKAKARPKGNWIYKCASCGAETAYWLELPEHMRTHFHGARRCGREVFLRFEPEDTTPREPRS